MADDFTVRLKEAVDLIGATNRMESGEYGRDYGGKKSRQDISAYTGINQANARLDELMKDPQIASEVNRLSGPQGGFLGGLTSSLGEFASESGVKEGLAFLAIASGVNSLGDGQFDISKFWDDQSAKFSKMFSPGISTNAADFLDQSAMSTGYTAPSIAFPPPAPSTGLLGGIGEWASKNPIPAVMAGQTVMAGIGGMAQAQAAERNAQANRDMNVQLHTVQGGFANPRSMSVNDPNMVTDMAGRYIRGPLAGQYAPGRAPGLLNARRV